MLIYHQLSIHVYKLLTNVVGNSQIHWWNVAALIPPYYICLRGWRSIL